jgi:hypothetical protein
MSAVRAEAWGWRPWLRLGGAVLLGNGLGFAAWTADRAFIPQLWAGRGPHTPFALLVGLVSLSFILLAAPPVLAGALGAWLGRAAHLWVGLACGLWSLVLVGSVPAAFPIAPGTWYAPTVLVLLSGAMGGWLMDQRADLTPRPPSLPGKGVTT